MLNRNIKLISVAIMFVSAFMLMGGCGMLDLRQAADGTVSTTLTDAISSAGDIGKSVGLFFPAAAGIGGLLSIIANGILGVVVKKKAATGGKLDAALTSVAAGVNVFVKDFDKSKRIITDTLKDLPLDDVQRANILNALHRIGNVKDAVSSYASDNKIYDFLRRFIKIRESENRA